MMQLDPRYMHMALSLAALQQGRVAPNPAVGCVIVQQGMVVGHAATGMHGRPHAETEALIQAGKGADGATLYVSLEPCCHYGDTDPCTEAIISARIRHVVVAVQDPDPRVSGKGIAALRAAGITVTEGMLAQEARAAHRGFFTKMSLKRPFVHVKIASTLDSHIATHSGESRWISSPPARHYVHRLRANHDAILVGYRTAMLDQVRLTCRTPGTKQRSPIRIVLDSQLELPLDHPLTKDLEQAKLWILTTDHGYKTHANAAQQWKKLGVNVMVCPSHLDGRFILPDMLQALAQSGITRLFVESGPTLTTSLLKEGLIDAISWIRAPILLGSDAKHALTPLQHLPLAQAFRLHRIDAFPLGQDLIEQYSLHPQGPRHSNAH